MLHQAPLRTKSLGWVALAACVVLTAASAPRAQTSETPPADAPVVHGVIDDEIGFATSAYIKRLLEQAERESAEALLLEINTFGGRVDAAVAIRDALLDTPVKTIAFINPRAISAGALISLSCDQIAIASGGTIGAATPIQVAPGSQQAEPVAEKYVSYFRQEMRATAEANGRNGDIAEAMVDADKEVEGISEKGKLLTLTTEGALKNKIADVQAESVAEVLEKLGLSGAPQSAPRTWSEDLVGFLTGQAVASLLFLVMVVCGYLEYQAPGFGFFGYTAVLAFLLLFFSHYLVNLAGWEEFLLFAVGVVLLMIELFVTPGFGLVGILGITCILASAVFLLLTGEPTDFDVSNPFTAEAVLRVLLSTAAGIVALLGLARVLPKDGSTRGRLILGARVSTEAGYTSHDLPGDATPVGAEGEALTPLRPAGRARIAGVRRDVESEGDYIAAGERVRVVRVEPGKIVVRRL